MKYLVLLATILLMSCSSVTVLRTQEIQKIVSAESKMLLVTIDSLHTKLDSMEIEQSRLQKRMKADMNMISSRMSEDYERFIARIEENQHRLDLLIGKSDKILSKKVVVEKRVTVNNNAPAPTTAPSSSFVGASDAVDSAGAIYNGSANTQTTAANTTVTTETTNVKTTFDMDMEKIYNTAKSDFHQGEYELAYNGFKQVYEKKYGTQLSENALYWMSLCLLEYKQTDKAVSLLTRVISEFPKGMKSCVSYFRLAQIAGDAGKKNEQIKNLEALVATSQCKSSNEAMKAADLLKQLKQ